jgi:DNA topoisomerase-1
LYVQLGEANPEEKKKPRRTSLTRGMDGDSITLEMALGLLSLPREVGLHPETKQPMEVGIGRFGPYVRMGAVYGPLDKDDDVLSVGINRAVDVLAKKLASVRSMGPHPSDKEPVTVRKGRFGPYVQHGQKVANLPRDLTMDDITMAQAVSLLAEKGKLLKPKGAKGKKANGRAKATPEEKPKAAEKPKAVAKPKAASKPKATAKTAIPKTKSSDKAAAR